MRNRLLAGGNNDDRLALFLHFIQQDFPLGLTVIDPHGALARAAVDIVPKEYEHVFYFDPGDHRHVASVNFFEDVEDKAKFVQDVCAFFDAMFAAGAETLTRLNSNFVLATVLTLITDTQGITLSSVLKFLTDTDFRRSCLSRSNNPMAHKNWAAIEEWDAQLRKQAFAQIQVKLGTLLLSPLMYRTLEWACTHFFENNDILIADLSRSKMGDDASRLLGTLLISRAKTPVYVNDFGFFASDYLASLFSSHGYTVAVQFLSTLPPNVEKELLGFDDIFVFRTIPEEADKLKYHVGLMERRPLVELSPGEFMPRLDIEEPRTTGRTKAVLKRSRACHTRTGR